MRQNKRTRQTKQKCAQQKEIWIRETPSSVGGEHWLRQWLTDTHGREGDWGGPRNGRGGGGAHGGRAAAGPLARTHGREEGELRFDGKGADG